MRLKVEYQNILHSSLVIKVRKICILGANNASMRQISSRIGDCTTCHTTQKLHVMARAKKLLTSTQDYDIISQDSLSKDTKKSRRKI